MEERRVYYGPVVDFDGLSVLPDIYGDLLRSCGVHPSDVKASTRRLSTFVGELPLNGNGVAVLKDLCTAIGVDPKEVGIHPPVVKNGWVPREWMARR